MKIFKLFPLACAALMMSACSSDDGNGSENPNIASEAQYLAVNIVNVGTTPTRAGEYEDGIGEESKINKIRFYFFHADGSPYILTGTTKTDANWLEEDTHTQSGLAPTNPSSVDQITNAILVIKGVTASAPSKVIAVVNPETLTTLGNDKKSLNDLLNPVVDKTFVIGNGATASGFVMSNSVYASENRKVCENDISGYVKQTKEDAEGKPVQIYVERVAAKVRGTLDATKFEDGTTKWNNGKPGIKVGTYSSYDIYAVVDGWGVADENDQANLEKQINPTWTNADLGFTSTWTTSDYHRSFWETSAAFSTGKTVNHAFKDYTNQSKGYVYTLPNTSATPISTTIKNAKYNDNTRTKFLVATHLMYNDGTSWKNAELCTYKGIDYLGVDVLKNQIAFESGYYLESTPGNYKRITKDEITFNKATTGGDYLVVPALVAGKRYYKKGGTEAAPIYTEDTTPAISTEPAQVRTDGMAYYYIPIQHLATDATKAGYYGIVRNHLYDVNVTGMKGFGTPVYNDDWKIIPTVPDETKTYLAAKINVLQWRVVSQNVNLGN
ncbi:Mfa1 family fimbria major subunit [Prevotella sp.]|uniref:Mfa1 family fimbria major subunit n=1 Tax=Prevotella sp. TaxID=59823 RepID=UPI00307BC031